MLRGLATIVLLLLNMLLWGTLILLAGLVKLVMPTKPSRTRIVLALSWLAERWVGGNDAIFDLMLPTKWDISGIDDVRHDGHYLIISNHISWVDIFALFRAFHGHAAFIRFFLKHQLIWAPIVGQACAALEFPFMRRYSPEYLEKHPEKRGRDLETARRLCRRYRFIPVAILNFVEGTRFSRDKHADQDSPYRHLLRPRAGGVAFALASLGEYLDAMFDVTLAYPGHDATMWEFVSGKVDKVTIRARRLHVPEEFMTSAVTEPGDVRERFKVWLEQRWREKDAELDGLLC
ncbi:MAG TPA: acyltransferase [Thermoanaerobaculia bacterium]|nr:acyltransferase [Thermoanaerobaculia bacterium]